MLTMSCGSPGLWLLVVLALIAAAICFANVRERGLKLPVAAAALLFAPAIVLEPAAAGDRTAVGQAR